MLNKKLRPKTFSEVKGQEKVVSLLRASLTKGNIPFVTILTGPFGTGKTTLARIVAKTLNCASPTEDGPCCCCESCKAIDADNSLDVLELDAASNNGVQDVLKLIEGIKYAPVKGKYRVYIIDEVHRLSPQAFDTLLKTFEEPPEYARFVLCTTEAHKVPATISSRGTKYSLEKISSQVILDTLKDACKKYEIPFNEDALKLIVKDCDGHMRDALKNLEDCMNTGNVTVDIVLSLLGIGENDAVFSTVKAIHEGSIERALDSIDTILKKGCNLNKLVKQFIIALTDLLLFKRTNNRDLIFNTDSYKESVDNLCNLLTYEDISDMLGKFNSIFESIQKGGDEFVLKNGLISLILEESVISSMKKEIRGFKERLEMLENALFEGANLEVSKVKATETEIKEPVLCSEEMADTTLVTNTIREGSDNVVEFPTAIDETTSFVPIEDASIMAEVPFDMEELPDDILSGFNIGNAITLDDGNGSTEEKPAIPCESKDREEDVAENKSDDSDAQVSVDDWFDAFARL